MTTFVEQAPAKINLSLRVLGRRPDGYHELESLVAFASVGDRLTLEPGPAFSLSVTGPSAAALDGENLVTRAVASARAAAPDLVAGRVHLEKYLPVASGIGGGSADAAAMLRLLRRANPERAGGIDWHAIAAGLGADVPVCLASRAALMQGIGERLTPLPPLPEIGIVLANPRVALATADVFRALAAPPLSAHGTAATTPPPQFRDAAECAAHLARSGNDLEAPARNLCPPIERVLSVLAAPSGSLIARMSGSGATCFTLFATEAAAQVAARSLAAAEPRWWVAAGRLA